MTPETIAGLIVAAVAVLGSIGSVLLLAFRVGTLNGKMDARMQGSEMDRANIWKAVGALTDRLNRHIEQHQRGKR